MPHHREAIEITITRSRQARMGKRCFLTWRWSLPCLPRHLGHVDRITNDIVRVSGASLPPTIVLHRSATTAKLSEPILLKVSLSTRSKTGGRRQPPSVRRGKNGAISEEAVRVIRGMQPVK